MRAPEGQGAAANRSRKASERDRSKDARGSILHTREQGLRVHGLANLGGLVAIAGLEHEEPDQLLGALLEVADRLPRMKPSRLEELRRRGAAKLDERGTGKRAWKSHQRARDLHAMHLTSDQLCRILERLDAPIPRRREDLVRALGEALGAGQ